MKAHFELVRLEIVLLETGFLKQSHFK